MPTLSTRERSQDWGVSGSPTRSPSFPPLSGGLNIGRQWMCKYENSQMRILKNKVGENCAETGVHEHACGSKAWKHSTKPGQGNETNR